MALIVILPSRRAWRIIASSAIFVEYYITRWYVNLTKQSISKITIFIEG